MRSLSYANITATLALVVALGAGGAWAATQLPKNSVGARQIKSNAVKTAKIKNDAVTSAKVKNGSLTAADLAAGIISAPTAIRRTGQVSLAAGDPAAEMLALPGVLSVSALCVDAGSSSVGVNLGVKNLTSSSMRIISQSVGEVPAASSIVGTVVTPGTSNAYVFPPSTATDNGHVVTVRILKDTKATVVNIAVLTRTVSVGCEVVAEVVRAP